MQEGRENESRAKGVGTSTEEDPAFPGDSHGSIVLGGIADHAALQATVPLQDLWEGVESEGEEARECLEMCV